MAVSAKAERGPPIVFHRDETSGMFSCPCGYTTPRPHLIRRHIVRKGRDHLGNTPVTKPIDGSQAEDDNLVVRVGPLPIRRAPSLVDRVQPTIERSKRCAKPRPAKTAPKNLVDRAQPAIERSKFHIKPPPVITAPNTHVDRSQDAIQRSKRTEGIINRETTPIIEESLQPLRYYSDSDAESVILEDLELSSSEVQGFEFSTPGATNLSSLYGLYFIQEYKVIICLQCRNGLDPNHVFTYLKNHHDMALNKKDEVEELCAALKPLSVHDVPVPAPNSKPIDNLLIYKGFTCIRCSYTAKHKDSVRRHIQKSSCFTQEEKATKRVAKYEPCRFQAFFTGLGRKPFPVSERVDERIALDFRGATNKSIEKATADYIQYQTLIQSSKPIGDVSRQETSPWLSKTGWLVHFKDVETSVIRSFFGTSQGQHQSFLKTTAKLIEKMMSRCRETYDRRATEHTRRWMNSTSAVEYSMIPFNTVYPTTEVRYFGTLRSIGIYLIYMVISGRVLEKPYEGLFMFNADQEACLEPILSMKNRNVDEELLEKHLFNFYLALIEHTFEEGKARSVLLLHAIGVLGLDPNGTFRPATSVSGDLAAIIYCAKMLLFRHACELASIVPSGEPGSSTCEQFIILHQRFLVMTDLTPITEIINLLSWAKTIGHGESSVPDIIWSTLPGIEAVCYKGVEMNIDTLKAMVQDQVTKAETILLKIFGINSTLLDQKAISKIKDDMSIRTTGYSFLTDPKNKDIFPIGDHIEYVFKNRHLRESLVRTVDGEIVWLSEGKTHFATQAQSLLEVLLTIFHLLGGQPARSTEIMKITWYNSEIKHRNIFLCDGGILWITDYSKGRNQMGWSKFIPRYLPSDIASIYISYLHRVLPLYQYFIGPNGDKSLIRPRYYFFSSNGIAPWHSSRLTQVLQTISAQAFGQDNSFGVSGYRHMAISMSRRYLAEGFDEQQLSRDTEDPLDLQACHSSSTADRVYGVRADIIHGISERSLSVFRGISLAWHAFFRSKEPALVWYERNKAASKLRQKCVCGGYLEGVTPATNYTNNPLRRAEDMLYSNGYPCSSRQRGPLSSDSFTTARIILTRLYGESAVFKSSEQALALQHVLEGSSPLVVVLTTGGGKSLLFEGPSTERKAGVTVVVVPFIAAREYLYSRGKAKGIPCAQWLGKGERNSTLVFITAKSTSELEFRKYIRSLKNKERLDRIIVDEAHMLIFGDDFRIDYCDLYWFSGLGIPVIFMTTILPPALQEELCIAALIRNPVLVRGNTARSNLNYSCIKVKKPLLHSHGAQIINNFPLDRAEKILVYTRSVEACQGLSKLWKSGAYYSSSAGKTTALKDWLDGKETVLITTSALAARLDIKNIRLIMFFNMPHTFVDFAQESGRVGRDGKPSSIILIYSPDEYMKCQDTSFPLDTDALKRFIATDGCRRLHLSAYFDGVPQECNTELDQLCDNCSTRRKAQGTAQMTVTPPRVGSKPLSSPISSPISISSRRSSIDSYGTDSEPPISISNIMRTTLTVLDSTPKATSPMSEGSTESASIFSSPSYPEISPSPQPKHLRRMLFREAKSQEPYGSPGIQTPYPGQSSTAGQSSGAANILTSRKRKHIPSSIMDFSDADNIPSSPPSKVKKRKTSSMAHIVPSRKRTTTSSNTPMYITTSLGETEPRGRVSDEFSPIQLNHHPMGTH